MRQLPRSSGLQVWVNDKPLEYNEWVLGALRVADLGATGYVGRCVVEQGVSNI